MPAQIDGADVCSCSSWYSYSSIAYVPVRYLLETQRELSLEFPSDFFRSAHLCPWCFVVFQYAHVLECLPPFLTLMPHSTELKYRQICSCGTKFITIRHASSSTNGSIRHHLLASNRLGCTFHLLCMYTLFSNSYRQERCTRITQARTSSAHTCLMINLQASSSPLRC